MKRIAISTAPLAALVLLLGGAATNCAAQAPADTAAATQAGDMQANSAIEPRFSWDTVPLWLRVRKKTAYTEPELARIAKYPVVVFEKANGYETYGDVESGTLAAAKGVKRIDPTTKIIFYFNAVIEYGNYRANEQFDAKADTWAVRRDGKIFRFKNRYNIFNLALPDVQDWWVKTAAGMAEHPEIDGVFIDALCKVPGYGEDYLKGYWAMAGKLRRELGPNKLLLANAVRVSEPHWNLDHLRYLDGTYVERWAIAMGGQSYEDYLAKSIEAMQKTVEQGKLLLFSAGPGAYGREGRQTESQPASDEMRRWMREHIDYPLAIFLIVAGERSYFDWTHTPDALLGVLEENDYPQYHKPLGKPLGPATRSGYVYHRRYEHVDVQVDIERKQAKLTWH